MLLWGEISISILKTKVFDNINVCALQLIATINVPGSPNNKATGYTKIVLFFVQTVPFVTTSSENLRTFFSFFNFNYFKTSCSLKLDYYQFFLLDIMIPAVSSSQIHSFIRKSLTISDTMWIVNL